MELLELIKEAKTTPLSPQVIEEAKKQLNDLEAQYLKEQKKRAVTRKMLNKAYCF